MDVQVNGVPADWPVPQLRLLVTGWPVTDTLVEADAVALPVLESFATLVIV